MGHGMFFRWPCCLIERKQSYTDLVRRRNQASLRIQTALRAYVLTHAPGLIRRNNVIFVATQSHGFFIKLSKL